MKIALVNPPQRWQVDPSFYPSIGINYVHAQAVRSLPEHQCDFLNCAGNTLEEAEGRLAPYDVIGYTCTTPYYKDTCALAARMKLLNPNVRQVLGGAHATIIPGSVSPVFDAVFVGDGTRLFPLYVRTVERKAKAERVWREPAPLDLETTAFPTDPLGGRLNHHGADKTAVLFTSMGCTHHCTFCAARGVHKTIKLRSPDSVYAEMVLLKERGVTEVRFMDDGFTMAKGHAKAVCERIAPLGMHWGCMVRVDQVTASLLETMKHAGCREVGYGVESYDQAVLNALQKGSTVAQNVRAVKMSHEAGLDVHVFLLVSTPGETYRETPERIITALEKASGQYVKLNFAIFMPHLGTVVERDPAGHGVTIVSRDYVRYNQHQWLPGPCGPVLRPIWSPVRIDGMTKEMQYENIARVRNYVLWGETMNRGLK